MKSLIDVKISFIRKFGLSYSDAITLFDLNPTFEILDKCLNGDCIPLINWLEEIINNNELPDSQRIETACLVNSIVFNPRDVNLDKDDNKYEAIECEEYDEYLDHFGKPKDQKKYSIFQEEKKTIEEYSETYLIEIIDKYIDSKSTQEWNIGKRLHRGLIHQEVYDFLHIYNFSWELNDEARRRVDNSFEIVWNTVENKREKFEMDHLDEWFEMYSKWLDNHGLRKSTKSNIIEFFKTISDVKIKSTTIDTIKNKFNS